MDQPVTVLQEVSPAKGKVRDMTQVQRSLLGKTGEVRESGSSSHSKSGEPWALGLDTQDSL